MNKCIFILPQGLMLGGVSTWSIKMARCLTEHGLSSIVIRHADDIAAVDDSFVPELQTIKVVKCPGKSPWLSSVEDLVLYLPTYHSALPGTFVPNLTFDTYATCALLTLTESCHMRVIGFGHSDEDFFYELLQYYEPIIHIFVAVSEDIAIKLKNLIPHRKDDVVIRPCGVDISTQLVRDYSLLSEPIQLMYGGRIVNKQKRVYDLLLLVKMLEKKEVSFHLKIVGSGNDEAWLRKQFDVQCPSSTHKITFEGVVPHNQMPNHWKAADICVMVSDFEGTSVSMLEAMAQGCVPVVTSVSGIAKVIEDGANGFTVPIGDMEKMADLIQMLASDRNKLKQVGMKAHQTVLHEFSFDEYLKWFLNLNEQVWRKSARPWPTERSLLPVKSPPSLYERALKKARKMLFSL